MRRDELQALAYRLAGAARAAAHQPDAVSVLIRRGDLPVVRIAGKLRIDVVDLDRLIEAAKSPT